MFVVKGFNNNKNRADTDKGPKNLVDILTVVEPSSGLDRGFCISGSLTHDRCKHGVKAVCIEKQGYAADCCDP